MIPVLTVFIDGLKPESLTHMRFLNTFNKRRIKTELIGYSPTCHASMYTGVYPNKHHQQVVWKYSPATSPFKILRNLKIHRLPHNIYTKYLISIIVLRMHGIAHPIMFSGFSKQPIDGWRNFDFSTVKDWAEPDPFIGDYPTIFKILKDNGVIYEIVGMQPRASKSSKTVRAHKVKEIKPFNYFYIGDIDTLSNHYGQDSEETINRLIEIDNTLEEKYKLFEEMVDNFYFMVFSDHGHIKIKERIDLYSFFQDNGKDLNDYIHFIDALHLRFWFRNEREKLEVVSILSGLDDKGYILTDEIAKKHHAEMPDNRYGDLIFCINPPYVSATSPVLSTHGYSPDYPESDGVFVSNKKIRDKPYAKLVDMVPSILNALGLEIPGYVDGESLWEK